MLKELLCKNRGGYDMTEETRKEIKDIIDYTGVEIDEAQLEQQLEAAIAEQL